MRNSAIGMLILVRLPAVFSFRGTRWPKRDYRILDVIALLSSIYDLVWLQTSMLH